MELKKSYEVMSDEEIIERYLKKGNYFPDAVEIMEEEIKRREINIEEATKNLKEYLKKRNIERKNINNSNNKQSTSSTKNNYYEIKYCKACGGIVETKVDKCPHCGTEQKKWFEQHKLLTGFGILILLIIISNGGNKNKVTENVAVTNSVNDNQKIKNTLLESTSQKPKNENKNIRKVDDSKLDEIKGRYYLKNEKTPFSGIGIGYFENGKIQYKSNYQDGKMSGDYWQYDENGGIEMKGKYENGEHEGEWLSYFENGQVALETNYINDKREGESVTYREDGSVVAKANYKNDEMDGERILYYPNGEIVKDYWENGKKVW
jgi:antitoxin component YwqK of YwqJK toxin-antitoxin module